MGYINRVKKCCPVGEPCISTIKTFECKFRTHTPKSTNQKALCIENYSHVDIFVEHEHDINVREIRRGNQEWKIQRHWQHCAHKTQDEDKRNTKTLHLKC